MLSAADDQPAAPPVVVLSYKFWQSDFGGSLSVVGKTVRLNNRSYTIAGVAEPSFTAMTLANEYDLWVPLAQQKHTAARWMANATEMGFFGYTMIGRLRPGVSISQAEAAGNVVFLNAMMHGAKPFFKATDDPHLRLKPAQKELRGRYDQVLRPIYVLLTCVGIILLIACANVAGLLLARAASREREIAVRLALGAKRIRLMMQLLVESLTLSVLGGAFGLVLAVWGAKAITALLFPYRLDQPAIAPHLDWRVLAFTVGVSLVTGVLFGMAPAWRSFRVDVAPSLKAAETSAGRGRRRRFSLGNLLVATQVALAVLVLATAGLLVRTLHNLEAINPGFDTNNLLLFGVDPRLAGYKGPQVGHLYHELQEKFAALPGVKSVGYSWVPLLGGGQMVTSFHKPGTPVDSKDEVTAAQLEVGPNFFSTLRIPLQTGRDLTGADFAEMSLKSSEKPGTTPWPVVVNQSLARSFFPNQNPLGQVFGDSAADGPWPAFPGYQIIGVVADAKYNDLRKSILPTIYSPITDGDAFFELRTVADPASLIPSVRSIAKQVDDNLALVRIDTEKGQIDRQLSQDRMVAQLSSFFGLLALVLACMGLYGLLSYEVTQRTREIGIRMAIGAQRSRVIGIVLRHGLLLAAIGGLLGAAASMGVSQLVASMLFGVKPGDPVTLAASATLLALVALAACYLPARRATQVDPLVALRYE
jgi:predicted permease